MKRINLLNKIVFVLILLAQLTSTSYSQVKSKLEGEINKVLSHEFFKSCQIAIDVYDLTSNKPLVRKNEKFLLRPASTIKLLTTTSSLFFLNDFKFSTNFYYTGEIKDSLLLGNFFIVGGLDPKFSLKDLDSVVTKIKKTGIKEIRGNIYADISVMDSLFWGSGWMWDDDPNPTSPYLSAININNNVIKINYEPGFLEKPALINTIPQTNFVEVVNNSITKTNVTNPFSITRDWINRNNKIIATGEISVSQKSDSVLLNIFSPTEYFLTLFKENLERNKIFFKGELRTSFLPSEIKKFLVIERDLDSIIVDVNKNSDNLAAEMLLRGLGFKYFGKPTSAEKGLRLIDSLIVVAGMDPKSFKITDGSGLSFYNLISAELLTQILKYTFQNNSEVFSKLFNSLPIAGIDGTLKNRMKNSPLFNNLRAKTGSLSGVSTLSGYLINKSKHLVAFTIFIQNFNGSAKFAREAQDKICELIYNN